MKSQKFKDEQNTDNISRRVATFISKFIFTTRITFDKGGEHVVGTWA